MKKERNNKVEKIFNSLDGIRKIEAPDFFFTRLKARIQKEQEFTTKRKWVLRPVYAVAMLSLLLVVNAAILFQGNDKDANVNTTNDENESLQTVASAYNLNDNLLYDINQ